MFNILSRIVAAVRKPAAKTASPAAKRSSRQGPSRDVSQLGHVDPVPAAEAREIHDDSAWDMWEQSQNEWDSRMGPSSAFDSVRAKDPSPSQMSELDPFASIRKRD
jgi:thioesterase domain-containing protein